jgi:uncharacterized membrane protein SirB2
MNMFQNLTTVHWISVCLFLLIYLVKTSLLLANKNEALEKFKKMTKVLEMIVSVVFLGTGIYLMTQIPVINGLLIIKLVAVALSIPVAIIGFKKNNKGLATLSLLLIIGAFGLAEVSHKKRMVIAKVSVDEPTIGPIMDSTKTIAGDTAAENREAAKTAEYNALRAKKLYTNLCTSCHGVDGKAKMGGATDLSLSKIDAMEAKGVVTSGRASMPAFGDAIAPGEINAIVNYIQSFKTKK